MVIASTNKNGQYVQITATFNIETGDYGFECRTNVGCKYALRTQSFPTVAEMYRELSQEIEGKQVVA